MRIGMIFSSTMQITKVSRNGYSSKTACEQFHFKVCKYPTNEQSEHNNFYVKKMKIFCKLFKYNKFLNKYLVDVYYFYNKINIERKSAR